MDNFSTADKGQIKSNTIAIEQVRTDLAIVALAVRALCKQNGITDQALIGALDKLVDKR